MRRALAQQKFIDIPISKGARPDWNTRLGYPQIFNLFVGKSGFLYSTPGLQELAASGAFLNVRAIHYTPYNNGSFIVVTNNAISRLFSDGNFNIIKNISFSGRAVQIVENLQNQVLITDGRSAYVYAQKDNVFFTLGEQQGFELANPISCTAVNNIGVILDQTNGWVISEPNNFLSWPVLDNVPSIGSNLTKGLAVETIQDNLYFFGTTGIERWEVNYGTNPYLFPFTKDNNFRNDFGALSTASVSAGNNKIYFLSSKFIPMVISARELTPLAEEGMAKIISQYPNLNQCSGNYYSFRGNLFFHLTFPRSNISWVYNEISNTWALSDDLVTAASPNNEMVGTTKGVYQLSLTPNYKKRTFISERITNYKGIQPYRALLSGVEVKMVQGYQQLTEPQYLELTLSLDSQSWLNTVPRVIGRTGERNATVLWQMNIAAYEYTIRVEYYGNLNLTIERVTARIN